MNRYRKRHLTILLLCALCLTTIFVFRENLSSSKYFEIVNLLPPLQLSKDETPIIVVDEHEEVIPYWYKAVEDGLILPKGNTLIHIDAHSDMAPPDNSVAIKNFNPGRSTKYNNMLPLMQSNDVFIVSAIMKELIDHVIWVQPSWNNESDYNRYTRNYVGISKTHVNSENQKSSCICQQAVFKKLKKKTPFDCFIIDRESPENKEIDISDCQMLKSYIMILVSEDRFVKSVKLNKIKELFIDLDEDYFGVQSGVGAFMEKGIRYNTVVQMDSILSQIFCPTSNKEEEDINEILKELFDDIWQLAIVHKNNDNYRNSVKELLHKNIADHMCHNIKEIIPVIQTVADYIVILQKDELKGLSKVAYCLYNSPRLHRTPHFGLCHGTIYPEDKLNQIHISNSSAIEKRAKNLEKILDFVYQHKVPKLYTIARSLRDGYTPRFQQMMIEELMLKSITNVIRKYKKKERIVYDENLVFGKNGWIFDERVDDK